MIPTRAAQHLRAVRLLVAAAMLCLLSTSLAWAHASLNSTQPVDGAVLDAAPTGYTLTFSEPVAPLTMRLVQPDGSSIELESFQVNGNTVVIAAPGELRRGTHVLSWRVVSADGHPIGGSLLFSVGEISAVATPGEEPVDWTVRTGVWSSKVALYLGLFLGIGGVFARAVLMPGIASGRRFVGLMLAIGAVAAILSIGFQGLDALGAPVGRLGEPIVWATGYGTSYGATVVAAVIAFLVAAFALVAVATAERVLSTAALVIAAAALALSGHASAADPQWLMRPTVFAHALAIALWIGALVPLGLAFRRGEATALPGLARFSRAMPAVLAIVVLAGSVLAVVQVGRPSALLDTAYGRVFLAKLALLVALFVLAAYNRWKLTDAVERGDSAAARRLTRSVAAEALIVVLIFAVAAAWRFTPPPRAIDAAALAPVTAHIHTDKAMADLTIAPGRAGAVNISAVIMTGDFGALDAKGVTFVLSNPGAGIEPFKREAAKPGDGTWRAESVVLPLAGTWRVRIDVLVTDFELVRLEGEIKIRN